MTAPFDLVVFDCDGILVDSERINVRTEAQILASLGWPLTEGEIVERFVGRTAAHMHREVERTLGRPVDWEAEFEAPCRDALVRELRPVEGVPEALGRIRTPVCVASSGTHEKIRFSLSLTGLLARFEGAVFSVEDVARGKPAPDLFLHAAAQMGRRPSHCAVVEDSASGVRAGQAAGMAVFAFAGGVTPAAQLAVGQAVVFASMDTLPDLLAAGRPERPGAAPTAQGGGAGSPMGLG